MHQIAAIIFDFDGLLVDSEPVQIQAWDRYLEQHGAETTPELLNDMYGRRLIDSSRAVVRHLNLEISPDAVAAGRDEIFLAMVPGSVHSKPGAQVLLSDLANRNVQLALATSGHRRYVELACESAGIERNVFSVQVTGEMVEYGKPDPETFLTAADLLGVKPERCLVLEDSPNGVRAALNAGMYCIAVPDAPKHRPALSSAHQVLDSLTSVLALIEHRLSDS